MLQKNKRRFQLILWSYYFLILLIPFCIILIIFANGARLINEESIKANRVLLKEVTSIVDTEIKHFDDFKLYLLSHEELFSAIYLNKRKSSAQRYYLSQMTSKVNMSGFIGEYADDVLIYFPDKEIMLDSQGYRYFESMDDNLFVTYFAKIDNYAEVFNKHYNSHFFSTFRESTGELDNIFYIDTTERYLGKYENMQYVVRVNRTGFDKLVDSISSNSEPSYLVLMDRDDSIVYTSDSRILPTKGRWKDQSFVTVNKKDDYFCYRSHSSRADLSYVVLVSSSGILRSKNILRLTTGLCIVLFIATTILIYIIIQKKEKKPMAQILSMLNEQEDIKEFTLFSILGHGVSRLHEQYERVEESLKDKEKQLDDYKLLRLLIQETTIEDSENFKNLDFPYQNFRIVLYSAKCEVSDLASKCEVIQSEIKKMWLTNFYIRPLRLGKTVLFIINYSQNENKVALINFFRTCNELFHEEKPIITLSSEKTQIQELHTAYLEVLDCMEQCLFHGLSVLVYEEKNTTYLSDRLKYTQYEKNFYQAVEDADYNSAFLVLNNIVQAYKGDFHGNTGIIKIRLYGMINMLLNVLDNEENREVYFKTACSLITSNCSIEELTQFVIRILYEISTKRECEKDKLISQIKEYIEENYTSYDLSANYIAEHFQIDISILSRKFKKEQKDTLSNYINMIRVARAKEMIEKTNISIKVIAEKCGYSSPEVFIRVFRRQEGITPGKYREIKNSH